MTLRYLDFSISVKILTILALLAVVTIGSTVFSTQKMRLIDDSYGDLIDGPNKANLAIARANRNLVYIDRTIYRMLSETTPAGIQAARTELTDTEGFFARQIAIAAKGMPSQARDIQHIQDVYKAIMLGDCADTLKLASLDTTDAQMQASNSMHNTCDPALNKLMEEVAGLTNKVNKLNDQAADAALAITNATIRNTYIMVLSGLLVVIVLALYLSRTFISTPIRKITAALEQLGKGNLKAEIDETQRRDEVGQIVQASLLFRDAVAEIQQASLDRAAQRERAGKERRKSTVDAVDNIERDTEVVAIRSAATSDALVGRAEGLVESAARMLASTSSVTEASANALMRSEAVAAAGEELSYSAQEIGNQIGKTMREIEVAGKAGVNAQTIIRQLSTSVGEIGSIAQLIGGIAERTNMLALNATIEAARAGEAGKGFAVVASEVKSLAQETGRSTSAISQNASAIQQATRDAVQAIGEMVERIAEIERITENVARATDEQTAATSEIARNVVGSTEAMRLVSQQVDMMIAEANSTDEAASHMAKVAQAVGSDFIELRSSMLTTVRALLVR